MSISFQARAYSLIILILSSGFGYSFWQTNQSLQQQTQTNLVVQDMIRGLFELNIITNEYIKTKSIRTEDQWRRRHDSLEHLFSEARRIIHHQDDILSLEKIIKNEVLMEGQYFQLQEISQEPKSKLTKIDRKRQAHLESQIRVATQEMLSEASRMSQRSLSRLTEEEGKISLLSITLIISLAIMALLSVILVQRKIIKPISDLQQSATTLAAGDYSSRIPVVGQNEISALASSYNTLGQEIQKKIDSITEKSERLNESQQQLLVMNENLQKMVDEQTADLRDSEAKQRSILESMLDGVISLNKDYIITSINPAVNDVFGYSETDLLGRSINMLIATQLSIDSNDLDHKEMSGLHKQGQHFPIELTLTKVEINGEIMHTAIVRDITERKRVEKIKNEFISTVSHELRTPLTAIRGSLGLISGGVTGELPDKALELLTLASNNTNRLLHLINDILDMQKIEAGKLEFNYQDINLMEAVDRSCVDNASYAEIHNVSINIGTTAADVNVHIDPLRLDQIFANLLSNAAKFSHKDGVVTIDSTIEGDYAKVSVTDQGEGIPLEFQNKLFSKFEQSDSSSTRQKGGTGLGLSITKLMIENMGGKIDFTSQAGEGSTFNIYLPITK
jgi:PAS domain S-box-containing protein